MSQMTDPVTGEVFPYFTRSEWGARPPVRTGPIVNASQGIFIHHTVSRTAPGPQVVRETQAFHMDGRGWVDIAYSFLVSQAGEIFQGRGLGIAGAHTENFNHVAHAICFVGNSDNDVPTPAALRAIKCVQHHIEGRYGAHGVRGHRDAAQTACPGRHLYDWVRAGAPYPDGSPPTQTPTEEDEMTPEQEARVIKAINDFTSERLEQVATADRAHMAAVADQRVPIIVDAIVRADADNATEEIVTRKRDELLSVIQPQLDALKPPPDPSA